MDELLNKLYYDPSGFMSLQNLYNEAKKQDNSIKLRDVKEWYEKNNEKNKILRR